MASPNRLVVFFLIIISIAHCQYIPELRIGRRIQPVKLPHGHNTVKLFYHLSCSYGPMKFTVEVTPEGLIPFDPTPIERGPFPHLYASTGFFGLFKDTVEVAPTITHNCTQDGQKTTVNLGRLGVCYPEVAFCEYFLRLQLPNEVPEYWPCNDNGVCEVVEV